MRSAFSVVAAVAASLLLVAPASAEPSAVPLDGNGPPDVGCNSWSEISPKSGQWTITGYMKNCSNYGVSARISVERGFDSPCVKFAPHQGRYVDFDSRGGFIPGYTAWVYCN